MEGRAGTGRIEAFSDGVFAIAITLLTLELKLPPIPANQVPADLPQVVLRLWPEFFSFVTSFLVIGLFWVAHHRLFRHIVRSDFTLLWLNLLLLMCIAFLPFPTELMAEHGQHQFSIVFYASSMAVTGLVLAPLWFYAVKDYRLVADDLDPALLRHYSQHALLLPLAFLVSIGLSLLVAPIAANLFWLLIVVAYFMSPRVHE
jgi:uncharacterized membrane protein